MTTIKITQNDDVQKRLDIFITCFFDNLYPRAKISSYIDEKVVLVNGKRQKPSYKLKLNDTIEYSEDEFDDPVKILSGGQKTRLALAKILLQEPKLLLLDEPTNHLDNSAITFLENYLKSYPNAIVVVSHDRYFIDQISNKIVEIENGKAKTYKCKYDEY